VRSGSAEWLRLLEAEFARRAARVDWEAGQDKRAAQQFVEELQQMARRLAVTADRFPLQGDDMSTAEKLACHLLPKHMQPPGLATEGEILAEFRNRKKQAGSGVGQEPQA
jgi:hypothetical protein